ncbi:MAG: SGNH/GDSL hydrolase family protein [Rubrivivax sp.]|jgi:lysophospholipase L1-like esterase
MSLVVKVALTPVLVAQAVATRSRLPRLPEAEGPREGWVDVPPPGAGSGRRPPRPGRAPLHLLVAGDSSAAGVGVSHQDEALAAPLAQRLAVQCGRPVAWQLQACSGWTTRQLGEALAERLNGGQGFDLAVVVTGVNDVVDQVPSHRAAAHRDALVNRLRNAHGVRHVAFAPLPPVGRFPGLPQPLRWVAGRDADRHNRALHDWAATRGDASVVDMQLPLDPALMAEDGFHPGRPVYRYCADRIAAHLTAWADTPDRSGAMRPMSNVQRSR